MSRWLPITLLALSGAVYAQDAVPPAAAPSPQVKKAETAEQGEQKPEARSEAPATKPADAPATPQRFVPSEQVRADFDVSFPIDI